MSNLESNELEPVNPGATRAALGPLSDEVFLRHRRLPRIDAHGEEQVARERANAGRTLRRRCLVQGELRALVGELREVAVRRHGHRLQEARVGHQVAP